MEPQGAALIAAEGLASWARPDFQAPMLRRVKAPALALAGRHYPISVSGILMQSGQKAPRFF
jgi:hypothetical protein